MVVMGIQEELSRYLQDGSKRMGLYIRKGDGMEFYDPNPSLDEYRRRDIRDRPVVVTFRGQPVPHKGHILLARRANEVAGIVDSQLYVAITSRKGPRDPIQGMDTFHEREVLVREILESEGFDMGRVTVEASPEHLFYEAPTCMAFRLMDPIRVISRERWDRELSRSRQYPYTFVHDGIEEYPAGTSFPLDRDPKDRKVSGHHISEMLILLPEHPEYRRTLEAVLPGPSFEMVTSEGVVDRLKEHYRTFDLEGFERRCYKLRAEDKEHLSRMKRLIH